MSLLFSGFWDAGRNLNRKVGSGDSIKRNYFTVVTPLSIVLFIPALICTILYITYSIMYTNNLKKSNSTVRKWAGLEPTDTLTENEIELYKFYENYKIATNGAIICLLTIIALCMIYLILKIGNNIENQKDKKSKKE